MNFQNIIFDFDMTIVDTSKGSALCYEKAMSAAGGQFNMADLAKYMGEFLDATYSRIENPYIGYEEFERIFYCNSHKHMATMSVLYDDALKVLYTLKKLIVYQSLQIKTESVWNRFFSFTISKWNCLRSFYVVMMLN